MAYEALKQSIEKPYTHQRPQIKECYVAYIDMLGYKQFFDDHPDQIETLLDAVTVGFQNIVRRLTFVNNMLELDKKLQIRCFSDNLLIFCECEKTYYSKQILMSLIEVSKEIQRILTFDYAIFVRGGITKGQFASNEMFVFGQALIDAVMLEEKTAKNPRIIISQSVLDDINTENIFDDPAVLRVLDELSAVLKLFETNSSEELAQRCYSAYKTFDNILAEIPFVMPFDDLKQLRKTSDSYRRSMDLIARNRGNQTFLEGIYSQIKGLMPSILHILKKVAYERQAQYKTYEKALASSGYFIDDDACYAVDYLNIGDFTEIVNPKVLKTLLNNFNKNFSALPGFIAWVDSNMDKVKRSENLKRMFLFHRNALIMTLRQDREKYEKFVKDAEFKYDERIMKKHLWSTDYHNRNCIKQGFEDFNVVYSVANGKENVAYVDVMSELSEVQ